MPVGAEVTTSPVLVGRDALLALAERRLSEAALGRGQFLLVAGEAGIGKTRLLGSVTRRAERLGFTILRAAAYPGDVEASGGLLLDLAGELRRFTGVRAQAVGRTLSDRLRDPAADPRTDGGDQHRRHRLLVQDLADTLLDLDPQQPMLLVLEDLHWADRLSIEVLGHVAGRLAERKALVLGAYRSDELFAATPMREWRSRLLPQRLAEEVRLPRLSAEETATLTSSMLGRPAPSAWVAAVHERSDGIPLHIEELVAAADAGSGDLRFPDTLADAILARTRDLDVASLDVAAAAAVIGRSFDFGLLTAVTERPAPEVETCLARLSDAYLVIPGQDSTTHDFRHALIRDALYESVPRWRRGELHGRVAQVSVERGYGNAFLSVHLEQAGLTEQAHQRAVLGAREASAASSHREALTLYRRALHNLPSDVTVDEHAGLLAALAGEAVAVDENAAATEAYLQAQQLWRQSGDVLAAAAVTPALAAAGHLLGESLEVRVGRLQESLASIEGSAGAEPVRAQIFAALSAAYMLARRLDESIESGEQSRAAGELSGGGPADLNLAVTLGSVLLFAGRTEDGMRLLTDSTVAAVAGLQEAEAARGYRMIGSSTSVLVEYEAAQRWLTEGIAYAAAVELWNHRSYMAAHLAHVQWACGQWEAAQDTAEHALADGRGGITTTITAEYVLGYLALGRGDWAEANRRLAEALAQGESMGELQRISPPLWGLAESASLQGDHAAAIALCDRGFALSEQVSDAAYLFPYLVTGTRSRLSLQDLAGATDWVAKVQPALERRAIPGTLPAVAHARGLLRLAAGDHAGAAEQLTAARTGWLTRQRFWEGTRATWDLARCASAAKQQAEARALATEARDAAARAGALSLLPEIDAVLVRSQAEHPWHPLTSREYEVAGLVAEGLTNREIADRLFLSPKTISSHVEHILAKLGAARRAEIAAWTTRIDPAPEAQRNP